MTIIEFTATLTSSFHHGAGTSGNTARLRTQEVITEDGGLAHVPFLSANSVRHGLRNVLAWHLANTLGFEEGTLTKDIVSLLWSGGGVTKTGAQTDLDMMRRVDTLLPQLGLLGYAAGADIVTGTLRASDLILVCTENATRTRTKASHPAAHYRDEEFGTRHDTDTTPVARFIEITDETLGTDQMIYSLQTLKPGAVLEGQVQTDVSATEAHRKTLAAAFHLWAPDGQAQLGAKTATGYGRATLTTTAPVADEVAWLTNHITTNADDIHQVLKDITA